MWRGKPDTFWNFLFGMQSRRWGENDKLRLLTEMGASGGSECGLLVTLI